MKLAEDTIQVIGDWIGKSQRPAALISFGKDSIVMADLIRRSTPNGHRFPVEVIYNRDPWFAHKNKFANGIIESWGMVVHDFPPLHAGIKYRDDILELNVAYSFGNDSLEIPKNVLEPLPHRDYICGLNDWLLRPKTAQVVQPWDLMFHGQKSSDTDPFEGKMELNCDDIDAAGVRVVFPLRHWSDDDIWDYIEEEHVPFQETRYKDRREVEDKWHNNDFVHACVACIDPRKEEKEVWCPKFKRNVPNVGKQVLQIRAEPQYLERR